VRLFALQLSDSEENDYGNASTTTYTQYVSSARGDILDRHGTVLVSNRASYNVTLQSFVLFNSDDPNGYLLSLAQTCIKYGIEYEDSLPLSMTTPYVYTLDELSSTEQYTYKKFLLGREWDADMTAENLAKQLKKSYHISDDYTEEEARLIMGLRYELDLPAYASAATYTLAEDISAENLAILKELSVPGMEVEATTVREYNTTYAAQLLGHVGLMTAEEYEDTYEALDYSMDATVGKDGLEAAFEEYLHGTDGQKVVTVTSDGTVVDEYWKVEPQSGANVVTTIDIGMQEVAEQALAERIQEMAEGKSEGTGGYDADSGAVVAMDVNTGEVLCAANYPTYDPNEYAENYQALAADESQPLANRAMQYAFAPGSTFKMITSLAAMRYGISPYYTVNDTGVYTVYPDYQPKCWIYTSSGGCHGTLDMRGALANSCNVYFYTMGDLMGSDNAIDCIDAVAEAFGFGQSTGSEVTEFTGQLASKELKAELYAGTQDEDWHAADTLMAAIGQSITTATPLQLCRYVATLANGGTLYNATFLRRAVASDFQSLIASNDYSPVTTGLLSESEYKVIQEGMRMCATEGTAASYFTDYDITVCCKTGTAQHGNGGSDNAAFVCWAPAENPEIAIAVYVQHGDTGGFYAEVAKAILDYYFGTKDQAQEVSVENTILAD
jgi:penicillin-binding protein 2